MATATSRLIGLLLAGLLWTTTPATAQRILVIGDSVAAWNGHGVADAIEDALGVDVRSNARSGANMSTSGLAGRLIGGEIPPQLKGGPWDWVVMIGGANDLIGECRCGACGRVLSSLVSEDGARGEVPALVSQARAAGARVVWADYYLSNRGLDGPQACIRDYEMFEDRTRRMAASDPGILWVDMEDVIDPRDRDDFAFDRVHPSAIGSAKIGALIAQAIAAAD